MYVWFAAHTSSSFAFHLFPPPLPPILTSRDALPSLRLLFLIIACFCISIYASPLPLSSPFTVPHIFPCPLISSPALPSPLPLPFPHLFYHLFPCPSLTSSPALSSPLPLPFPHLFPCPSLTSSPALPSPLPLPFPHLFPCPSLTSSPALPSPLPLPFPPPLPLSLPPLASNAWLRHILGCLQPHRSYELHQIYLQGVLCCAHAD